MAKLDIDFILLDESVVQYGFRALMSGAQLEGFKRNPVMLFMHERAMAGYSKPLEEDVVLPIGKWYDVRIEGDKLLAKPEFDDDDEFALRIQKKVEKGYLNAASICLEPIAATDEDSLKLPGQTLPTITKWSLQESSIVDIPNCRNALAIRNSAAKKIALRGDDQNEEVHSYLNSLLNPNNTMDKKLLAARLGLPETATDAEISTKLAAVLGEAGKVTESNAEIVKLKADKVDLEQKLAAKEKEAQETKVNSLVDGAIASKKLAAGDREKYVKLAKADFDTTKELIDSIKAYESPEARLAGGSGSESNSTELQELMKLSGRELYMDGKLQRLKDLSLESFKLKYKEYYGSEYTGQ